MSAVTALLKHTEITFEPGAKISLGTEENPVSKLN